jgi:hypothetical protein
MTSQPFEALVEQARAVDLLSLVRSYGLDMKGKSDLAGLVRSVAGPTDSESI